jgi:hypothetical protein
LIHKPMPLQKVISVTPAGRRQYLEILVPYLLRNRDYLAEHHFWLNTNNRRDIEYITALARQYPEFFKIKRREVFKSYTESIWQYFQDCGDEDTIYVRLDDDICFIAPDAIPNFIDYRIHHPEPFLIYGNIVNNAICTHIHQAQGLIPNQKRKVGYSCMDPVGWGSGHFAAIVHRCFLADAWNGRVDQWKFDSRIIDDCRRFSINVICWFGKDIKQVEELSIKNLNEANIRHPITGKKVFDEESLLTEYLPTKFNRPNTICGDALFSHFAFYTQRPFLEGATVLLDQYGDVLTGRDSSSRRAMLAIKGFFKPMTLIISVFAWRYLWYTITGFPEKTD